MSLKVVPFKSLGAVSYSPSVVTMAVSVAVCDIQGGPIKTVHFMRYHIFAANTDIIIRFLLSVQKLQQKTTSDMFLNEC